MDFVRVWSDRTEIPVKRITHWAEIASSTYHDWRSRYGQVNEHNAWIPRDHWLQDEEKQAIVDFHRAYPLEGYRRLTFMMLDRDIVEPVPKPDLDGKTM